MIDAKEQTSTKPKRNRTNAMCWYGIDRAISSLCNLRRATQQPISPASCTTSPSCPHGHSIWIFETEHPKFLPLQGIICYSRCSASETIISCNNILSIVKYDDDGFACIILYPHCFGWLKPVIGGMPLDGSRVKHLDRRADQSQQFLVVTVSVSSPTKIWPRKT